MKKLLTHLLLLSLVLLPLSACQPPAEEGDAEEAMEETAESVEEAAEEMGGEAEEAGEAMEEGMEEAGEAMEEGMEEAEEAAEEMGGDDGDQ